MSRLEFLNVELDIDRLQISLQGECRKYDPDLHWPDGEGPKYQKQIEEAKAVCAACPIRSECLQWAEDNHEYSGIWGGLTEGERKAMRKETNPGMLRKVHSVGGRITGITNPKGPREIAGSIFVSSQSSNSLVRTKK